MHRGENMTSKTSIYNIKSSTREKCVLELERIKKEYEDNISWLKHNTRSKMNKTGRLLLVERRTAQLNPVKECLQAIRWMTL